MRDAGVLMWLASCSQRWGVGEAMGAPAGGGYGVDLDAVRGAAGGIRRTVDQVRAQRVEDLEVSGGDVGHEALAEAVGGFCGRWQHGVGVLVEDGEEIARQLGAAVDTYAAAEQGNAGLFGAGGVR